MVTHIHHHAAERFHASGPGYFTNHRINHTRIPPSAYDRDVTASPATSSSAGVNVNVPVTSMGMSMGAGPGHGMEATPSRKRIAVACGRCRKRKIRCSGDPGNGGPCHNCKNAGADTCLFLRVASTEATLRSDEAPSFPYSTMSYPRHYYSPKPPAATGPPLSVSLPVTPSPLLPTSAPIYDVPVTSPSLSSAYVPPVYTRSTPTYDRYSTPPTQWPQYDDVLPLQYPYSVPQVPYRLNIDYDNSEYTYGNPPGAIQRGMYSGAPTAAAAASTTSSPYERRDSRRVAHSQSTGDLQGAATAVSAADVGGFRSAGGSPVAGLSDGLEMGYGEYLGGSYTSVPIGSGKEYGVDGDSGAGSKNCVESTGGKNMYETAGIDGDLVYRYSVAENTAVTTTVGHETITARKDDNRRGETGFPDDIRGSVGADCGYPDSHYDVSMSVSMPPLPLQHQQHQQQQHPTTTTPQNLVRNGNSKSGGSGGGVPVVMSTTTTGSVIGPVTGMGYHVGVPEEVEDGGVRLVSEEVEKRGG